jgi:hypothetical protein
MLTQRNQALEKEIKKLKKRLHQAALLLKRRIGWWKGYIDKDRT